MKNKIIISILLVLISTIALCNIGHASDETTISSTRYAFVLIASSRGEKPPAMSDPTDKNFFWLGGVRVYAALRDMGFDAKNITVLYADGMPDFDDPLEARSIKMIKEEQFNGTYDNRASKENILAQLRVFSEKVTDNDIFMFYLGTHGAPEMVEVQVGDTELTPREIQNELTNVRPLFGLFYSDACHSGAFIKKLNLPKYVLISTTTDHTYGWGDRFFSGGATFFQALKDPESDANVDGNITIKEAYVYAQEKSFAHMKRIDSYLRYKYIYSYKTWNYTSLFEGEKISVQQTIRVGKEVKSSFSLYNVF